MIEDLPKKKKKRKEDIVKAKMTLNLVYKDEFDQRLV